MIYMYYMFSVYIKLLYQSTQHVLFLRRSVYCIDRLYCILRLQIVLYFVASTNGTCAAGFYLCDGVCTVQTNGILRKCSEGKYRYLSLYHLHFRGLKRELVVVLFISPKIKFQENKLKHNSSINLVLFEPRLLGRWP